MAKWNPQAEVFEYEPEGNDYIPIEQWGSDHWSTLAYLETAAVDEHGVIDNRRMRCNARLHRHFANLGVAGKSIIDGSKYPTRLKDGTERDRHDDWSCLEDMIAAGLLRASWYDTGFQTFGGAKAKVEFTPLGLHAAGQLRAHRGSGGNYATFEYVPPMEVESAQRPSGACGVSA